jgi:XTP/dITP diphosphohydrolase
MNKIILASNNKHKISEFRSIFSDFEILSLSDIGFFEDIDENGTTFVENSLIKARAVSSFLKKNGIVANVIADDSGLCVDALNGEPGIYSARYSESHNDKSNREKLLENLKNETNRNAHFNCTLVELFPNGKYLVAEGKTYGLITTEEIGDTSFGYDCLFFSTDLNKTFGEATSEEKNSVSHRGRAIEKLKKLRTIVQ